MGTGEVWGGGGGGRGEGGNLVMNSWSYTVNLDNLLLGGPTGLQYPLYPFFIPGFKS